MQFCDDQASAERWMREQQKDHLLGTTDGNSPDPRTLRVMYDVGEDSRVTSVAQDNLMVGPDQ
jgi:hypothetical protein